MADPISGALTPNGQTRPRIVIVGAGFGGLTVARGLARAEADILLVDRTNHHVFQPLLYQAATAALAPSDIARPIRGILSRQRNTTVLMGEVTNVDPVRRLVTVADTGDFAYDCLVLAAGSSYSWFGHDEWARDATVLKSLADADAIKERLLTAFERAESSTDPAEIDRLLTFVVVGGGPTGVELAGSIAELARSTLARDFRRIQPKTARIVLCEAGGRVLSEFPPKLSDYAGRALASLGVQIRLNAAVEQIDSAGVVASGARIDSSNIFWCAGTKARPAADWLGAEAARNGAIKVLADCTVAGHPDIFAIGDVSSFDHHAARPLPGLAAVAVQQGDYVAEVIAARVAGRALPGPFRYKDRGTLAIIGRSRAVADLGRVHLTGFSAWLFWSLVHLFLLSGHQNRVLVYIKWSWAWFTYGRGARLITWTPARAASDAAEL